MKPRAKRWRDGQESHTRRPGLWGSPWYPHPHPGSIHHESRWIPSESVGAFNRYLGAKWLGIRTRRRHPW
jgi:hypothetical protein